MFGACSCKITAASSEQWIRPGRELLSIRLAVLTVSPNKPYRGLSDPITFDTTLPEWKPTRILTKPLASSSRSIWIFDAASTASTANSAMRLQWVSIWLFSKFVTPIHASPIVSTLKTSCLVARSSKASYSRPNISQTFSAGNSRLMSVKWTISEKKIVTFSCVSASTRCPALSLSATFLGKTRYNMSPSAFCVRLSLAVISSVMMIGSASCGFKSVNIISRSFAEGRKPTS
mmetsp:Transcript_1526/g.3380  ORF Transcript_1526/g.3380 Transcript_1526/m.3380 type:complete len:232 (+) Transcript_1526:2192-2887(+)